MAHALACRSTTLGTQPLKLVTTMADNYLSDAQSERASNDSSVELEAKGDSKPWQNFTIAFFFGALLSYVGLSISMDMTHTALASVSLFQWSGAIAFPVLLGLLAVFLKDPFLRALETAVRLLPY